MIASRSSLVREPGQHRGLHRSHDLTGLRADHREAEDAVVGADKDLHKALRFIGCLGAQHAAHRQMPDADRYSLGLRFTLAQPDARQRRVGEGNNRTPAANLKLRSCRHRPEGPRLR